MRYQSRSQELDYASILIHNFQVYDDGGRFEVVWWVYKEREPGESFQKWRHHCTHPNGPPCDTGTPTDSHHITVTSLSIVVFVRNVSVLPKLGLGGTHGFSKMQHSGCPGARSACCSSSAWRS
jgi:hypothetical protein